MASYRYQQNIDTQARFTRLSLQLDNGLTALLELGKTYTLTPGEVQRASQYIVLVSSSDPPVAPFQKMDMPVLGSLNDGDYIAWDSGSRAFVPTAAVVSSGGGGGGGGGITGPVTEANLDTPLADKINIGIPATRVALGSATTPLSSGTAQTITLTNDDEATIVSAYLTLSANCTITVLGIGTLTSCTLRIYVSQDGTGGRTLAIKVGSAGTPTSIDTLATAANAKTWIYAYTDDGTNLIIIEPSASGGGGGGGSTTPDGRFIVDSTVGDGAQNARPAIQSQLDAAKAAGGGHVYVPGGTYLLAGGVTSGENLGGLLISSNTKLELNQNATIKRANNSDGMLRPDSGGNGLVNDTGPGAYTGSSNIEVLGGTWDGNKASFATAHNIITFEHGDNVTVRNTVLKNCFGFHFLEFNACRNGRALNVTFQDYDATTAAKEMLQIDAATTPVRGGLADGTPSVNILVEGCTFRNGSRGVGSHIDAVFRNIRILGNHFDTFREEAVRCQEWFDSVIADNTIINSGHGIMATCSASTVRGLVIDNNSINIPNASTTLTTNYGIFLEGVDVTNRRCREVTISGNTVLGGGSKAGAWGINVRACQEIAVTGNHVSGWNQSGIAIWLTQDATVSGNSSHRNNTSASANHGDILMAAATATGMQDVIAATNNCDTVVVGPFGDRVVVADNIIATSLSTPATLTTNFRQYDNFIAGVWGQTSTNDPFRFDATRLATFKTAIAARATAPVNVLVVGHSIAEGDHVTFTTRWQSLLRGLLRTRYSTTGVTGGVGSVPPQFKGGTLDGNLLASSPWTISGAATDSNAGMGKRGLQFASGQTGTLAFTGTGFDLSYLKGTGGGTNGSYAVDGGGAVTINSNAATTSYALLSVRGLTAGSHTVVFTGPTTNRLFVNDVMVYNGDEAAGIRSLDAGRSGAIAGDFLDASVNDTAYNAYTLFGDAHLIIVESGGINEWGTVDASRRSPRQMESDLRDLISGLRGNLTNPPSIIMFEDHKRGISLGRFRGQWLEYTNAVRRVASLDPFGITLFDSQAVLGDAATNANGWFSTDLVHPLAAGHTALANALDSLIASA